MYNPSIHHRRSIRLKEYDYAQPGLYFITICVEGRLCLFGEIINGQMILNDAGQMVEKWYLELENKFPDIQCGEFVVMPNHFHCIVENVGINLPACAQKMHSDKSLRVDHVGADLVGTDLRVCPDADPVAGEPVGADLRVCPNDADPVAGEPVGADLRVCPDNVDIPVLGEIVGADLRVRPNNADPVLGEHTGSPLQRVIQWFKTMTTNEYIRYVKTNNRPRFKGKLWQRNYWEHIICNQKSYKPISQYITCNPQKWDTDIIHPNNNDQELLTGNVK